MPSPPDPQSPPSVRLVAGSTAAEFIHAGDRWRHEVTTAAGRWASLEGPDGADGDPAWPASPALVEVMLADLAGGPALLAVGLAGRSHFSLSVAPCPLRPDTLLFEAACRIHEAAGRLGSAYRAADGTVVRIPAASAAPPATVAWRYAIGPWGIGEAAPPSPPAPR